MAAAGKRRKKAPARRPFFTTRRVVVGGLAATVFVAALILNTDALITLPIACATGACGRTAQWVVWACGGLVLATIGLAIIRRPRASPKRQRSGSGGRAPRKTPRKPAAGRQAASRQSAGPG